MTIESAMLRDELSQTSSTVMHQDATLWNLENMYIRSVKVLKVEMQLRVSKYPDLLVSRVFSSILGDPPFSAVFYDVYEIGEPSKANVPKTSAP